MDIEIPIVKQRKVPRKLDENPSSSFIDESKEAELRRKLFYPLLDSLIAGIGK